MKQLVVTFILIFIATPCVCDRISDLEQRVGALEQQVSNLESDLVVKFGLVRRCPLPSVQHGLVTCGSDDRIPGTTCSAECGSGYVATPNHHKTKCLKSGDWSIELKCEIPLLVVSGGTVDGTQRGDSGVQLLSFHNSTGCELNIPDMPQTKDGEHRIMHNLVYVPNNPFLSLLACNGLTQAHEATCDSWRLGDDKWNYHSNTNKGDSFDEIMLDLKVELAGISSYQVGALNAAFGRNARAKKFMSKSGRYAAASFCTPEKAYIVGGMIHNTTKHLPTKSVRRLDDTHWKEPSRFEGPKEMIRNRAFFCIAKSYDDFLAIGGYSGKMENTMENLWHKNRKFSEMAVSRSGHACTGIGGGQILVSGGIRSDGTRALAGSEMFSRETGRWESVGEMARMRFGHALVNVGGRIIALGGKERSPDVVLATGEEFDPVSKSWSTIGQILEKPRANFGYTLIPHSLIPGCKIYQNPKLGVGLIHGDLD